jgi:hypothetical protein
VLISSQMFVTLKGVSLLIVTVWVVVDGLMAIPRDGPLAPGTRQTPEGFQSTYPPWAPSHSDMSPVQDWLNLM